LGPRDLIAVLAVRCDKFVIVTEGRRGDPLGTVGLAQLTNALRTALLGGEPSPLGPNPTRMLLHVGQALLHRDPMLRPERAVQRALDEAMKKCFTEWAGRRESQPSCWTPSSRPKS